MLFDTDNDSKKTFEKTRFFDYSLGMHRVRLLPPARRVFVHYVRRANATIECLGSDCPICENNKKLKMEHPNTNAYTIPGYVGASKRHYVNVLDRTEVKVCPKCGAETKKGANGLFPPNCSSCNEMIVNVQETPSNRVKLLNLNDTNATQINSFNMSVLDADKNPIGVENFDIVLMITQVGDRKNTVPFPDANSVGPVEVTDELYDLDKAVIRIERDEIVNLMSGVSLKDIFAARKATKAPEVDQGVADAMDAKLKEMFGG